MEELALGLSISLEIAKLLGGEIHLESEEGNWQYIHTLSSNMYPPEREVIDL